MSRLRANATYAKSMLGETGEVKRLATLATVHRGFPGQWLVSALDETGDGGIYSISFEGPNAQEMAVEYASEKFSGLRYR